MQYFGRFADRCRITGVDVDQQAIAWCSRTFDFATFSAVQPASRTGVEPDRFDVIYAYSVFSHLPEKTHREWLEELHRISRSGALLVLTTMGRRCLYEYGQGRRQERSPTAEQVVADMDEAERTGFLFYPYSTMGRPARRDTEFFGPWSLDQYGSAFILPAYVKSRWSDLFEIVAIYDAPDNWQDYIVLRRA